MTLDGDTLIPEAVAGVARGGFLVELSVEGRKRNEATYRTTLKLLEGGSRVYGMNTGVGALKAVPIPRNFRKFTSAGCYGAAPSVPAKRFRQR